MPAAAERPVPREAERFFAAVGRGDLRAARAELAPRTTVRWADLNRQRPARLEELREQVAGCERGDYTVSRQLEDPALTRVHLHWFCQGKPDVATNLEARGGRLHSVEFGPPIVPVALPPGFHLPQRDPDPPETVARMFLSGAVGGRDEGWAGTFMAPGMQVLDRRSGLTVAFTAIADHVERCGLAAIERSGASAAVSRWTCPDGVRLILFTVAGEKVGRVELAGATP
jgi:hypothetical protein